MPVDFIAVGPETWSAMRAAPVTKIANCHHVGAPCRRQRHEMAKRRKKQESTMMGWPSVSQ